MSNMPSFKLVACSLRLPYFIVMDIAILASGSGSNLEAILSSEALKAAGVKCAVVFSNIPDAFCLARARKHGIPTEALSHKDFNKREEFDREVVSILKKYNPDLICLAGYMRIITPYFVQSFKDRIINIHPSLLPSFPGIQVQKKAIEYGVRFSGATVHFVNEGTDTGPIIIQAVVPILEDDTEDTLAARILKEEHRIYPEAIRLFAEGRLKIEGRTVRALNGKPLLDAANINPEARG